MPPEGRIEVSHRVKAFGAHGASDETTRKKARAAKVEACQPLKPKQDELGGMSNSHPSATIGNRGRSSFNVSLRTRAAKHQAHGGHRICPDKR